MFERPDSDGDAAIRQTLSDIARELRSNETTSRLVHREVCIKVKMAATQCKRFPNHVEITLFAAPEAASTGAVWSCRFARGGQRIANQNLRKVEDAIAAQVGDGGVRGELLTRLRSGQATIRLVGPAGFRVSQNTILKIEQTTGQEVVVMEELLLPWP